jgi:hypothetical protein
MGVDETGSRSCSMMEIYISGDKISDSATRVLV